MVDGGPDLHPLVPPRVRERLLAMAQARGVELGMVFLDGTSIRAHAKAAEASKKGDLAQAVEVVRRSGALVAALAKACVIADAAGRAVAFRVAPGQAHELPHAVPLLDCLPSVPRWVVADRGYASHAFREHVWSRGARPAIPPKRTPALDRSRMARHWADSKAYVA